ncbi:hypothetical protein Tco_0763153 [Tanacetum coccineum]
MSLRQFSDLMMILNSRVLICVSNFEDRKLQLAAKGYQNAAKKSGHLRVFENDVKGSTASSSSTQNVAFIFENTSSTKDVSTAYSVSNPSGQNSQYEQTYSLLANQSSCPQLDHEDLEQLDEYDLEEMDLIMARQGILHRECRHQGNQDIGGEMLGNSGNRNGKQNWKEG